jgi:hypothetical protein
MAAGISLQCDAARKILPPGLLTNAEHADDPAVNNGARDPEGKETFAGWLVVYSAASPLRSLPSRR